MAEDIADQILRKVKQTANLYYRLLVVVAPVGTGKTTALQAVHDSTGAPLVNVNLELSRRMLDLTDRQRSIQLPLLLREVIEGIGDDIVLLDNIEVLFDDNLKQDPLRLLQGFSRNKTIVAAWNGTITNDSLIYATPGHPEYRRYPIKDFIVVSPEMTT